MLGQTVSEKPGRDIIETWPRKINLEMCVCVVGLEEKEPGGEEHSRML